MIPLVLLPPHRAPAGLPHSHDCDGYQRMSTTPLTPREVLDRLDARHDELIERLDELNAQIEAALAEFTRSRELPALEGAQDATARKAA